MKKRLLLVLILALSLWMVACVNETSTTTTQSTQSSNSTTESTTQTTTSTTASTTTTTTTTLDPALRYQTIELFSMNDFHGGAYSDIQTLSMMGEYLKYKKDTTDHSIIMATGDIFQGSAFSNYYYGLPIVEIMNYVGFDAFVLGNHEFDWGIDKIAQYNDDLTDNGEAIFPFLAANIVSETSNEMMPWTDSYTIVDINGLKVGIIGVIGDVINSISASRVEGYDFLDAADVVADYAYELRTVENCDLVVVSIHEYNEYTNQQIANLTGDYRVDALFNGHTHQSQYGSENGVIVRSGADLPHAQASNYSNSLLAKITLTFDRETSTVIAWESSVLNENSITTESAYINDIIDVFSTDEEYTSFVNQVLANAQYSFSPSTLARWGSSVIRDYASVDFGMLNTGGFRLTMDSGTLTMGEMVEIYPFDNYIKTVDLYGYQLHAFCDTSIVFDDRVSCSNGQFRQDGVSVISNQLYSVGAVDYIFDKVDYDFLGGINIQTTPLLMRDLLVLDLLGTEGLFNPANGTSYQEPSVMNYHVSSIPVMDLKVYIGIRTSIL